MGRYESEIRKAKSKKHITIFTADIILLMLILFALTIIIKMTKTKIFLLAVILLIITPQLTQTVTVTVGDNEPWDRYAFESSIKLTNVYAGQIISFYAQYSDATSRTGLTATLFSQDGTTTNIATSCSPAGPCAHSYAAVPSAGTYYLTIIPTDTYAGLTPTFKIIIAQLNIFGDSNLRNQNILYQGTLALQMAKYHKIYNSLAGTTLQVKFTNVVDAQKPIIQTPDFILVYPQDTATPNQITVAGVLTATKPAANANQVIFQYTLGLPGFYWIILDQILAGIYDMPSTAQNSWTLTVSYATERYQCPYDESYPDTDGVYSGCLFPTSVQTFPCLTFNSSLGICKQCINGYTLSEGTCLENNCTSGQYKHYGVCYPLPQNCVDYNPVLGCNKCVDSSYRIVNKTCTRIPLNCTGRTYYDSVKYICANVNALCNTFNDTNGNCLTCLSAANQVVNGSCVPTPVITCADRQYALNGVCYNVDSLCSTFVFIGGQCISCIQGFRLVNGTCVQIQCQNRFVPDVYGNCKQVSPLCVVYNIKGFCSQCISGYGPDSNGNCLQYRTPNPCPARQYLGFDGDCKINQYCNATNPWDGSCASCSIGYYLYYTGQCVVKVVCKSRQYIINNACYNVSVTCQNFNATNGKCISCISQNYQLYFGLCVETTTCGARQWKDDQNVCRDVSSLCGAFNPSSGACITCLDSTQTISNGACVKSSSSSALANCYLSTTTMGCLQCTTGYEVSYNSPNGLGVCV